MTPFFLRLHKDDNVLVLTQRIMKGSDIMVEGRSYRIETEVPPYFKIASRDILEGERITKSGMSIGVAVHFIPAGQLVHTHNMRSDYLNSFTGNS